MKILVLGVGPGAAEYVLPRVRELALTCQVLIGGRRNLELFPDFGGEKKEIGRDIPELLTFMEKRLREGRRQGVLVSGDPGLFSLLPLLRRSFPPELLEVVPGISSLQYLFARIGIPWHDAAVISMHGRKVEELPRIVRDNAVVGIFTGGEDAPARICSLLLQEGIKDRKVYVGENLSYENEKIQCGSVENTCGLRAGKLNVMVIIDEKRC